jgi:hypothetical protein
MKRLAVEEGLWTFYADNYPAGIALRRHPHDDGYDDESIKVVPRTSFLPMQKIYCDRKVTHPKTGVDFYRVQGTEGWVFDKRGEDFMMLPESKIQTGLFAYRSIGPIAVRRKTNVGDKMKTGRVIADDEIVVADLIRESPFNIGNGPFLRLDDGSGWLFEKKYGEATMEKIPIEMGRWTFIIKNEPSGIGLRRQPIDRRDVMLETIYYEPNKQIVCDRKIASPLGVNFFRVKGTVGWVFDSRNGKPMMKLTSSDPTFSEETLTVKDGDWTPEYVRGIAGTVDDLEEIMFNPHSSVISFRTKENARINVYYTTRTVATALDHPYQGKTQLFRRNCSAAELREIMKDPRIHTEKGYQQKRSRHWEDRLVQTANGPGFVIEEEEHIRNSLVECDKELEKFTKRKLDLLKSIRRFDVKRDAAAKKLRTKEKAREAELENEKEGRRIAEEIVRQAALARETENRRIQNSTCGICGRILANPNAKAQHVRAAHKVACYHCERIFTSEHALDQSRRIRPLVI